MKKLNILLLSIVLASCTTVKNKNHDIVGLDNLADDYALNQNQLYVTDDLKWENYFINDNLRELIYLTLENNRDLKAADLNAQALKKLYKISTADKFPSVGASIGKERSSFGAAPISDSYSAGIGVSSWELDVFGRISSLNEQALQNYLSTVQGRNSTELLIISNVASAFVNLQAQYALLNLVKDTIKTYQDSYNITKKSYDAGSVNAMLLAQSNTALQGAKVSLASVEAAVKTSKNTLRALVGGAVDDNLLKPIPLDSKITAFIPDGVDSETLLRRPDILMAEHALKAADANIDAARAAFFPSISLTGTAGYASNDLDNLFKNTSEMWSFKPSIYLPIFNSGKLSANLDYATLMQNSKMAAYEQSIINAFTEVSGVLDNKKMIEDQLKAHSELLKTSNEYYKLAKTRYDNGVDSYLTLLDAQRNLFSVQQNYVQQKTGQLVNSISLYKVLGGGF